MSDEYWLRTNGASALLKAAEVTLLNMGMVRRSTSTTTTHLSASWPDADPSVEAWGGNVHLALADRGVLLTLNGVGGPAVFAEKFVAALGIEVSLEDT